MSSLPVYGSGHGPAPVSCETANLPGRCYPAVYPVGGFAGDAVGNARASTQQPLLTSLPALASGMPAQDVGWVAGPDRTAKDQKIDPASDRVGPGPLGHSA